MADKTFRIDADISPFQESMRQAAQATQEAAESIQGIFQTAFSFAGIDIAAEAIGRVRDKILQLGESAIHLQSMSDVLSVTTAQFQTMQFASEEVGVGIEIFQRASEKLKVSLDDARQGSSKAIDELHRLGITNAEIADPTFQLNDLLEKLHDGLNNAGTATSLQAELLKVLGARSIQAVEAIKAYDGTEAGVARSMAEVNGLSDRQIQRLSEMARWWKEVGTWAENAAGKILVAATTDAAGVNNVRTRLLAEQHAQDAGAGAGSGGATDAQQQQLEAVAVTAHRIYAQVMGDVLKSEQAQIEATQQGTSQRLALARQFYEDSLKYYGSDTVDAVRKAYADMIAAGREYDRTVQEGLREQDAANKRVSEDKVKAWRDSIKEMEAGFKELEEISKSSADNQMNAQIGALKVEQGQIDEAFANKKITAGQEYQQTVAVLQQELTARMAYYRELETLALGDQAKLTAIAGEEAGVQLKYLDSLQQAHAKMSSEIDKTWKSAADTMASSFSSAIDGMLTKNRTFTQTVLQLGQSLVSGLINNFVKMGIAWAEQEIMKMIASRTAAAGVVAASAGAAGAAGTASFAAAPWPIDIGAPAFGAGMAAVAGSFAVAEQGYDIPAGINPAVQAHAREMILPANLSEGIRDMVDGGGASGGFHMHVNANDSRSFERQLTNSSSTLYKAVQAHIKRGGR